MRDQLFSHKLFVKEIAKFKIAFILTNAFVWGT